MKWIKKMCYICAVELEYYLSMKNKEILASVTTRIDSEGIMLSEISQECVNFSVSWGLGLWFTLQV